MRSLLTVLVLTLVVSACGDAYEGDAVPELAPISPTEMDTLLTASSQPVLVNVWASWCSPCRSEAPLLRAAHRQWGDRVRFIGVDVRDSMDDARGFIAEFGLDGFEHRFDRSGGVPAALGGSGVPLTFFFLPGGDLAHLHHGVIDERTLALWLDEIARAGGS